MTMLLLGDAFSLHSNMSAISGGRHSALAVAPVEAFKVLCCASFFHLIWETVPISNHSRTEEVVPELVEAPLFQQVICACCRSCFSPYVRSLENALATLTV